MADCEAFSVEEPGSSFQARRVTNSGSKGSPWLIYVVSAASFGIFVCVAYGLWPDQAQAEAGVNPSVETPTPWWILEGVVPEGPEKDMGSFKASSFSKEQQEQFGIDEQGKVLEQSKFDKALAALKLKAKTPWWILAHVTPRGTPSSSGAATFSAEQQDQFGIDAAGVVLDKNKFDAAMGPMMNVGAGLQVIAPWWIRHNVKPEGALKDMDGWQAVTFSKEQQKQFACDELGVILDRSKYEKSIAALNQNALLVLPPWWLLEGIVPNGPDKDMGGWTASSFSKEQQEQFGIDDQGTVLDHVKFNAAIIALDPKNGWHITNRTGLPRGGLLAAPK